MEPTPALAVNVASAVEPAPNNTPLIAGKSSIAVLPNNPLTIVRAKMRRIP
jgi:hypothetical protein